MPSVDGAPPSVDGRPVGTGGRAVHTDESSVGAHQRSVEADGRTVAAVKSIPGKSAQVGSSARDSGHEGSRYCDANLVRKPERLSRSLATSLLLTSVFACAAELPTAAIISTLFMVILS